MTSQALTPGAPDPYKTLALEANAWVKIKIVTAALLRAGFNVGDVVQIRRVMEKNTTPGQANRWKRVLNDTAYAIHCKAIENAFTEELSPSDSAHFIPHKSLREKKLDRTYPNAQLAPDPTKSYYLAVAHTWPLNREIKAGTWVKIVNGPNSKKGPSTASNSNPAFWNYRVSWSVPVKRQVWKRFDFPVEAENFETVAVREPDWPRS